MSVGVLSQSSLRRAQLVENLVIERQGSTEHNKGNDLGESKAAMQYRFHPYRSDLTGTCNYIQSLIMKMRKV